MRSEFDFIQSIKKRFPVPRVGDDCAVLPKDVVRDLVITADLLIEDIDFRLDWTTPELLGHKTLAVSLSDIAAMGGTPEWAMLSVGLPERVWDSDFLDRFYHGWHELAGRFGVELVGGDVSKSPDKVLFDSIVAGTTLKGRAVLRSGALAGDAIFVTGSLGGAAGGLELLKNGFHLDENLADTERSLMLRQLKPQPQLALSKSLDLLIIATAMIDISDGFSSDLHRICEASGVGALIEVDELPIDRNLCAHFSPEKALDLAINGGEDFELLFTADPKRFSGRNLPAASRIGEVTAITGTIELIKDGAAEVLRANGFRHF